MLVLARACGGGTGSGSAPWGRRAGSPTARAIAPLAAPGAPTYAGTMAVLTAAEIYRFARAAGFDPGQAATMTAIALAESGGETGAHNPVGEDSRGLWQINVAAHPDLAGADLSDPLVNAQAAYAVSGGGADISPWTVTHGGASARYLAYRDEAEVAAALAGDPVGGAWSGTSGYGDTAPAGGVPGGDPGTGTPDVAGRTEVAGGGDGSRLRTFLDSATAQDGDVYVFGAQADVDDADPDQFDCSDLVRWSAGRAGVDLPDGSWRQYLALKAQGLVIPVEEAVGTPGALLFNFPWEPVEGEGRPGNAHVAISMGDGRTIEAMNPTKGVLFAQASERRFNFAAVIPGISDGTGAAPAPAPVAPAVEPGADTDGDGVTDTLEASRGLDAARVDSDGDGSSDGYELLVTGTDPARADTDADGIGDSHEPLQGTDPLTADTDLDGFTDHAELLTGFSPVDALSSPLAGPGAPLPAGGAWDDDPSALG